jgi:hypothetical protein
MESMEKVEWIYQHTHEKVDVNLAIIELAVFKNIDKGLNREIEIGDKSFYMIDLYKYLDEAIQDLGEIVVTISKKYSIDMPISSFMGMGSSSQSQVVNI